MIRYLLDSSALWRILRDSALREAWADVVSVGAVGSCHAQRVEFRRSARTIDEYEQMSGMFDALYPDAPIPKGAWRWIESAQYRLLRQGAHRALSTVDLLICVTAAQHDLVVLHDDKDFATAARCLPDVRERTIYDVPQDGVVTESWITIPVTDVRPGDRVRLASGQEVLVSRIEASFLGRENMVAFIEDTPDRWFKQPMQLAAEVEVLRAT